MATVDWTGIGKDLLGDIFAPGEARPGPDFGDRYEVRDLIGKGGQGVVHAAYDRVLEREVAIKRLHDPGAAQLPLRNEARTLSRLAHPAIPQIYDQGRSPDGGWFVVMQRIRGQRLDKYLDSVKPGVAARLLLFRSLAGAVAHAHRSGILHRDLKPENVLVTDAGEPYLVDWGLAANGGPRSVCGSPNFAAPEQLEGQVADRRADVFALGVLLYCVLCDELPYGRMVKDFHEFRQVRAGLQRIPLRQRRPDLPAALERICEVAMAAQPAARYVTVDALIADLDAVLGGRPLARDLPRWPWRRLALAAGLLLGFTGGVLLGAAWFAAGPATSQATIPVAAPPADQEPPWELLGLIDPMPRTAADEESGQSLLPDIEAPPAPLPGLRLPRLEELLHGLPEEPVQGPVALPPPSSLDSDEGA